MITVGCNKDQNRKAEKTAVSKNNDKSREDDGFVFINISVNGLRRDTVCRLSASRSIVQV